MEISVVIPAYNRKKTIKKCLESVFAQTMPVNEIIIVNDCSTDSTPEIISAINHPKIKLINHSHNQGAQVARNTGIKQAKSQWIAFLDSDDTWEAHKIEKQIKELQKRGSNPYTVVHSDGYIIKGNSPKKEYNLPFVSGKHAYQNLLRHPGPAFPAMLTSKKALENIGMLDREVLTHQEWETAIRLAKTCTFAHIQAPLFSWHIHGGETISANQKNHALGYEYIIRKHQSDIKKMQNGYWWDNHLKALIVKKIKAGDKFGAKALLHEFINKTGQEYYISKLILRTGLAKDISAQNILLKAMHKAWRIKQIAGRKKHTHTLK